MAKKEETPEPAEKPEGETPAEQDVSAEQPVDVQPAVVSKEVNKDACMWPMICHPAGLLINIVSPSNMRKNQPKWKGAGNVILC